MYGYVYITTNLLDGKLYIGMHKWSKNTIDTSYLGSGIHLKRAIKKYGRKNFKCEILEWCETREKLSEREAYWVSYYKAPINENFYNMNDGGFGGHSEYYVLPITQSLLDALEAGRHLPSSEKQKEVLRQNRLNCVVSEETRLKLREGSLNRVNIHKGTTNKNVKRDVLDTYLSDGWELGYYRDKVKSSTTKGLLPVEIK